MSTEIEQQSAKAQTELLLGLNSERHERNKKLARHEFRQLMHELRAGDFLLRRTGKPEPRREHGWHIDARLRQAFYAGLPVLDVPLGTIATSLQPARLPCIGIRIANDPPERLSRALMDFFAEHHRKPFCRPLFLSRRLDVLPFLRRFGFAAHPAEDVDTEYELLRLRYGTAQVRDLVSGRVL